MKQKIKVLSPVAGYYLAAKEYDKREAYLNSFEKGKLLPLLGDVRGLKILDVGAGTGRLTNALVQMGAEVSCLDSSEKMLEILKKKARKNVSVILGNADDMPFADDNFDWVIATFLIVHLKDPTRFFDEAYRVLKNGGRLLVTNINQKEAPEIETKEGIIKIESFYHRPEKIKEMLASLAFAIEEENFVKEGERWVNQIVVAKKV